MRWLYANSPSTSYRQMHPINNLGSHGALEEIRSPWVPERRCHRNWDNDFTLFLISEENWLLRTKKISLVKHQEWEWVYNPQVEIHGTMVAQLSTIVHQRLNTVPYFVDLKCSWHCAVPSLCKEQLPQLCLNEIKNTIYIILGWTG